VAEGAIDAELGFSGFGGFGVSGVGILGLSYGHKHEADQCVSMHGFRLECGEFYWRPGNFKSF
jgi:hypothetical protein